MAAWAMAQAIAGLFVAAHTAWNSVPRLKASLLAMADSRPTTGCISLMQLLQSWQGVGGGGGGGGGLGFSAHMFRLKQLSVPLMQLQTEVLLALLHSWSLPQSASVVHVPSGRPAAKEVVEDHHP